MPPIRNTCVIRAITADLGAHPIYTVPNDNNFILKSIIVAQTVGSAWGYQVGVGWAGNPLQIVLATANPASGSSAIWSGWTVVNAGDDIWLQAFTQNVSYWIAGALLPYVPGF